MGDGPKRGGEVRGLERQIVGFAAQRRARAGRSMGGDVDYVKAVASARGTGGGPLEAVAEGCAQIWSVQHPREYTLAVRSRELF